MNFIEAAYLVSTYLIIQDNEIHSNELLVQSDIYQNISEETIVKSKEILSDSEGKISLDELFSSLKLDSGYNKEILIKNLYTIALSDFYLAPEEIQFIQKVSKEIDFSLIEAENYSKLFKEDLNKKYKEKKQSFLENITEGIAKIGYHLYGNNELFENKLLEGNEFVKKVKGIAVRAYNDLDLARNQMELINATLNNNFKKLEISAEKINRNKRNDKEANALIDFIDNLNKNTKTLIQKSIKKNIEVLRKKEHSIDYFTIAFLGRTKVGKSTFHKVITGEKTDDIGVGKLRTTRYNRTFNWENIRIIDTPGIGAPGGMTDTQTTRGIIDEADLICYIVTNDAIQETEFNFLSELKEKNKPLFIILNYKENLMHPARLTRFLNNPLAWKEDKGDKSINGHIERIKEMISKNYDSSLIEIIPVQLLAAKLAESTLNSNKKKLIKGSNISEYNKKIKQTIFRTGHLKKTQNIIDGCNYQINLILSNTKNDLLQISELINNFKKQKLNLGLFINARSKKTENTLRIIVQNTHNQIKIDLQKFATNHWESKDIGKAWNDFIEQNGYYNRMKVSLESEILNFQKNLSDRMEESMQDLEMNLSSFKQTNIFIDATNYKFYANIAIASIATIMAGLAIANIWNPAGWVIGVVTGIGVLLNLLLDSKDKRIKKAEQKIIDNITAQINQQQQKVIDDVTKGFNENIIKLSSTLNNSFNGMIEGSEEIQQVLVDIRNTALKNTVFFNKVLVYRILEHQKKLKENVQITNECLDEALVNVQIEREGERITIKSHFPTSIKEQEEISKILQLNIEYIN